MLMTRTSLSQPLNGSTWTTKVYAAQLPQTLNAFGTVFNEMRNTRCFLKHDFSNVILSNSSLVAAGVCCLV